MRRYLTSETRPQARYDVCIIGAGAAGISLAQKLRSQGLSVFLAEGGGEEWEDESQAIYQGDVKGDAYFDLETARLRYFGGTTNHWGGMCRPLEELDFEAKTGFPLTAWPITRSDLDPFLNEARKIVEVATFPNDSPLDSSDDLRRVHFVFSPPVRFGEKFRDQFSSDLGIDVVLHANAQDAVIENRRIQSVRFENFQNDSIEVNADAFILACGGIENNRLLLQWNRDHNDGLGNQRGLVGRYWMEHPTQTIGEVVFCEGLTFDDDDTDLPISATRLYLAPTKSFMTENGTLNCRIRLDRTPDMSCTPPGWLARLLGRAPEEPAHLAWLRSSSEQEPVYSNHIALSDALDRFGNPRATLHWRRSEVDRNTFREPALALGQYLADNTKARMRLHDWVLSPETEFSCDGGGHCPGGYHHMGGTRMADSPETGVVDRNAKVFGTENLYCAGSSVFPSGGFCNPTFSIVQLSLRLGDYLANRAAR
ncbi:Choline dehydrogenase [Shimia gijangensis]|uniref:Choline dehydrogenase n=1 Tax=Shimia gijangensis TaxID=1470563 RepID=A0A1M6U4R1_9RHOB|nr:GMC oxidoreductase [Shimia gijangensis]SHK64166.1 Choline dehydrogenase [Shimia gijangensis]